MTSRTAPASSGGEVRPDIEGLRALAVISVLLYHARLAHVGGGYVGVDVFFVLSGFLITRLLLTKLIAGESEHFEPLRSIFLI